MLTFNCLSQHAAAAAEWLSLPHVTDGGLRRLLDIYITLGVLQLPGKLASVHDDARTVQSPAVLLAARTHILLLGVVPTD